MFLRLNPMIINYPPYNKALSKVKIWITQSIYHNLTLSICPYPRVYLTFALLWTCNIVLSNIRLSMPYKMRSASKSLYTAYLTRYIRTSSSWHDNSRERGSVTGRVIGNQGPQSLRGSEGTLNHTGKKPGEQCVEDMLR